MRERMQLSGAGLVAMSAVCYGTVPIIATAAFRLGMNTSQLLAWRFVLAAALLWGITWLTHRQASAGWRVTIGLVLLGTGYAAQSGAFFVALHYIPAPAVALLLYTYPSMVTIGSAIFLREPIDFRKVVALLCAFAGTGFIVRGSQSGISDAGVGFALASAAIYSVYIIVGSRVFSRSDPVAAAATVMTSTAFFFLVTAAGLDSLVFPVDAPRLGTIGLIVVVGTAIPVLTFLVGMPRIGASRAAILSTLEPVVTVVLAGFLLDQPLDATQWGGAILVLASVVVLEVGRATELPALRA
jgi:drug/metabolite transporter (DMT)-like permease